MRQTALVVLIVLLGCTHYNYPFSVAGLKEQGYQLRGSNPSYEVWSKETRDDGRRIHLCIVPKPGSGGYVWNATVYVDGREAWKYSIGGDSTQPPLMTGIDCATSDPLPEGVVSTRTLYKYWH
jgi:hypothetical protein